MERIVSGGMEMVNDTDCLSPTQWLTGCKPLERALQGFAGGVAASNELTPAGVVKGLATKDNSLLHNGGLNDGQNE